MTIGLARRPDYGRGEHEIAADDFPEEDASSLVQRIVSHFQDPDYVPPILPAVAMRLHALGRQTDVPLDAIVQLLESDPILAAKVLKVAQSSLYGASSPPASLKQALVRLGLNTLQDIVFQVALSARVFRCERFSVPMESLRRHSVAVAHLSRVVCRYAAVEGEYAFLCGLLHDIGTAGILLALGDSKSPSVEQSPALWQAVDAAHEEASKVLTGLWELPQDIQWVVSAHHGILIGGAAHPMAAAVALADGLAAHLGYGFDVKSRAGELLGAIDKQPQAKLDLAAKALGLDSAMLAALMQDAKAMIETLEA